MLRSTTGFYTAMFYSTPIARVTCAAALLLQLAAAISLIRYCALVASLQMFHYRLDAINRNELQKKVLASLEKRNRDHVSLFFTSFSHPSLGLYALLMLQHRSHAYVCTH